ncbi:hypothetical protein [Alkaliphilus sp. B6464]|uniref:hypothetical protein n=1 Tax=Alkaliphilus sp. B6464 TaxID=2731219 RepID=UPI001BA4E522|nr:hypothetical protein [Alkaliphilus sp. B6464]QUH22175.1 hypothetical protein HYG84_19905 [Alkaliphilus sp. B6464]
MREFNIILKDGTGRIIDAIDESEIGSMIGGKAIVSIEETEESIRRNSRDSYSRIIPDDPAYEAYLEQLSRKYEPVNKVVERVKKTIKIIENNNRIPVIDKQFIYGLGRLVNMGNVLSNAQEERFNRIYTKIAR